MYLLCVKEIEGFTLGETYKLLGVAGEYIQLKDDSNNEVIVFEGSFEVSKCSKRGGISVVQ